MGFVPPALRTAGSSSSPDRESYPSPKERPMQRIMLVAALAVLCLFSAAELLRAPAPAPDAKRGALKALEERVKERDEREAKCSEERIRARLKVREREEAAKMVERLHQAALQRITAELSKLEDAARRWDEAARPEEAAKQK